LTTFSIISTIGFAFTQESYIEMWERWVGIIIMMIISILALLLAYYAISSHRIVLDDNGVRSFRSGKLAMDIPWQEIRSIASGYNDLVPQIEIRTDKKCLAIDLMQLKRRSRLRELFKAMATYAASRSIAVENFADWSKGVVPFGRTPGNLPPPNPLQLEGKVDARLAELGRSEPPRSS